MLRTSFPRIKPFSEAERSEKTHGKVQKNISVLVRHECNIRYTRGDRDHEPRGEIDKKHNTNIRDVGDSRELSG